ncbi:signal peptidase II [Novispirillum itersonii]|uniref:signal peptidase II n=1 Tax=Novispirillum itersonii TaxID=189 RepID=UPI0003652A90|nr:signal peptidase II [Novispirillum itersonii]
MMRTGSAVARVISLAGAAVAVDQGSKALALIHLRYRDGLDLLPGLRLTLAFNEGAGFGLLAGVMAGRPLLMAALTGGITLLFAVMALRSPGRWEQAGLALITGGSLGNIVDRLRQGAVTDFIDLYWRWPDGQTSHWPTFNGADIAIVLGAACMLLSVLTDRRQTKP